MDIKIFPTFNFFVLCFYSLFIFFFLYSVTTFLSFFPKLFSRGSDNRENGKATTKGKRSDKFNFISHPLEAIN